jgi:hypothetical protein
MPLERDEGEFAYLGQLMLQGIPPYKLAFNMKLPGTYAAYAGIMGLFGQSPAGIHFGFLLVNLAALALLFLVARRFLDSLGALVSCTAYALLTATPLLDGLQGHATHLVALAALAGLLLLLRARENGRAREFFLAGLFLGIAFLCKQPGLFFGLFAGLLLIWDRLTRRTASWKECARRLSLLSSGFVLPFLTVCLLLWRAGTFARFWFWTVQYVRVHAGVMPLSYGRDRLLSLFTDPLAAGTLLAVIFGFICLWFKPNGAEKQLFLTGWLFFSACAVASGFYFTSHYFIAALPAACLFLALGVSTATAWLSRRGAPASLLPVAIFIAACLWVIWDNHTIWLEMPPDIACLDTYPADPFVECREVADFIRQHSAPADEIAVVGSEPEIYFYARRHSASGYIYMYDLVETQPYAQMMQREFMRDVETHRPLYLVFVNIRTSWMAFPRADRTIFDWSRSYPAKYYDLAGMAVIYPKYTEYLWGNDASLDKVKSSSSILVFRRKSP